MLPFFLPIGHFEWHFILLIIFCSFIFGIFQGYFFRNLPDRRCSSLVVHKRCIKLSVTRWYTHTCHVTIHISSLVVHKCCIKLSVTRWYTNTCSVTIHISSLVVHKRCIKLSVTRWYTNTCSATIHISQLSIFFT